MTLKELFDCLDWTSVRASVDPWYGLFTTDKDHQPMVGEDYFCRFWCNIIYVAFFHEPTTEREKSLRGTALNYLGRVGMLTQVMQELEKEGLYAPDAKEAPSDPSGPPEDPPAAP